MHMAECSRSRSPARAATPAARCCACCSPTRRSRSAPSRPAATRASASARLQPHLLPLADRILEPTTPRDAGRPRRGLPRPPARPVRPRSPSRPRRRHGRDRLRRRLPADRRRRSGRSSTAASTPAPGPTACPSSPTSAAGCSGATPDRRTRLLPHRLHPRRSRRRSTAGLVAARHHRRRRQRH